MMKIIDLTHLLNSEISVYPGAKMPVFQQSNTVKQDGFAVQKMTMNTHTGTHMDAPAHILAEGKSLDQFNVEKFYGKAICIDCGGISKQKIEIVDLKPFEEKIKLVDFVLLRTDWSEKWRTDEYFGTFPTLSETACEWLADSGLKGVGLDVISIDPIDSSTLENHHTILGKGMVIIENLTNLSELGDGLFIFSCYPLKIENADGSPIRAVAIIDY